MTSGDVDIIAIASLNVEGRQSELSNRSYRVAGAPAMTGTNFWMRLFSSTSPV